ncbi:MAG: hypothetical protein KJO60_04490, partial [Desulfofustis sp.]|nr:hypothetical protein [Desulfofustis sp.]
METTVDSKPAVQSARKPGSLFWSVVVYGGTLALTFCVLVEMINIFFYDPWGDEKFLFRTAGILAGFDISTLTWIMFGSLVVFLMAGLPLAFVTGGLGCVFIYMVGDQAMLNILPSRIFPMMTNSDLSAIPLFI